VTSQIAGIISHVSSLPFISIDLGRLPRIEQAGLCLHGLRAAESFRLHALWSLHAYHYQGEIRAWGNTSAFRSGWISLIPPDTQVEWHFPSHAPHHYVHFVLEASGQPVIRLPSLFDFGTEFDKFCAAFEEMIQFQMHDPQRAAVRLWDLLHQLRHKPINQRTIPSLHPSVQIALSLIRTHRSDKITVRQIAQKMGVSHNHLTQVFKKSLGVGVKQFIQRDRLNRACHLLTHSSLAIKSIAIETGIPDLQYFNKLIRTMTELSPRAYRAANKEKHGQKHTRTVSKTRRFAPQI
jgi:AraC-like DNA-binding protein